MADNDVPPQENTPSDDHALRAITDDDNFRVIVVNTTETVRGVLQRQKCNRKVAGYFADLLTGMVMIRETMAPTYRVQGVLRAGEGGGSLVADTHPDGVTRGLMQNMRDDGEFAIGKGAMLQVMRSMARGQVHRSVVRPPEDGDVSGALMAYLQESEQIVSVIAAGAHWQNGELIHAGGYVVQLLPDAERGPLMVMTQRLEELAPIGELLATLGGSPSGLLQELLYHMPHTQLERRPVSYGCKCSRDAVVASLAALSRDDLSELVRHQEVVELSCDYCMTDYSVGRTYLQGLLNPS